MMAKKNQEYQYPKDHAAKNSMKSKNQQTETRIKLFYDKRPPQKVKQS